MPRGVPRSHALLGNKRYYQHKNGEIGEGTERERGHNAEIYIFWSGWGWVAARLMAVMCGWGGLGVVVRPRA